MHAMTSCNDVALADGDPPQNKPGNPKTLGYVLMYRSGTDLNSSFVSVFEPYRDKPFITSVQRLDKGDGAAIIIKVEKTDGRTDYLLYNPTPGNVVKLPNGMVMNGTIGYIAEKDNKADKAILINGTSLVYGKMKLRSAGAIEGKIVKMDKGFSGEGWLLVDTKLPVDRRSIGEQITIETKGERDASYTIRDIQKEGKLTKIFCGPVTFVSGSAKEKEVSATVSESKPRAYVYDFEEGASFKIADHVVWGSGQ
jgi:hypothetical protein